MHLMFARACDHCGSTSCVPERVRLPGACLSCWLRRHVLPHLCARLAHSWRPSRASHPIVSPPIRGAAYAFKHIKVSKRRHAGDSVRVDRPLGAFPPRWRNPPFSTQSRSLAVRGLQSNTSMQEYCSKFSKVRTTVIFVLPPAAHGSGALGASQPSCRAPRNQGCCDQSNRSDRVPLWPLSPLARPQIDMAPNARQTPTRRCLLGALDAALDVADDMDCWHDLSLSRPVGSAAASPSAWVSRHSRVPGMHASLDRLLPPSCPAAMIARYHGLARHR